MGLLNTICYGSAFILSGVALLLVFACFCTSVATCFMKKVKGNLIVKIAVAVSFGCICPLILRMMLFFIEHMDLGF
jgi:hypothetical protein